MPKIIIPEVKIVDMRLAMVSVSATRYVQKYTYYYCRYIFGIHKNWSYKTLCTQANYRLIKHLYNVAICINTIIINL